MLELPIIAVVLLAALLHAVWNALLKVSGDQVLTMGVMMASSGAICLALLPLAPLPPAETWKFIGLSMLLHTGYYVFLLNAYRVGDFSQVYPIARGTGPMLVALLSGTLIGETLQANEWIGVATITAGLITLRAARKPGPSSGVPYALCTGACIAGYTIADGMGVRASGQPFSYILWMNFADALPMSIYAAIARRGQIRAYVADRVGLAKAITGGLIATIAYGLVVLAYSLGAIASVAALRETSVVIAALIGSRMLGEPLGHRRVAAAAVVAAGIIVLNLG